MPTYTLKNRGAFAARIRLDFTDPSVAPLMGSTPRSSTTYDPFPAPTNKDDTNKVVLTGQDRSVRPPKSATDVTLFIEVDTGTKWKRVLEEPSPPEGAHTWKVSGTTGNIKLVKKS